MKKYYGIKESIFIKDSLNQSFVFFINNNQNLIFNRINTEDGLTIIDKNVLDFSAAIDENNRLHLLYLQDKGELIYCVYSDKTWQKNLFTKLDTQSNIYKYLTLLVHKNSINIFYAFANLINLNLWTIEHITKNKDNWQKHIVANIFSEKIINPFYMDNDEFGNIYLVYSGKEYNNYNIYYLFFNTFTKRWTTTPTKISSSLANNVLPYIFVDSENNVHILWYSSDNKDYFLNYKRFSSTGDSKFQWQEINLPKILGNNYHALMFEKYNKLNIIYISEEEIFKLTSKDYGITWILEDKTFVEHYPVYLIKYYNLSINKGQDKINHYYGNMDNGTISFYLDNSHKDFKVDSNNFIDTDLKNENMDITSIQNENNSNLEVKELEELKNALLEMEDQLEAIKNDVKLIKDKLGDVEEKLKNKKGFFNIW